MKIIQLHKNRDQSVLRRHPWIFSRAIDYVSEDLADGDAVYVQDAHGKVIGTGHYQDSSLAVRLLAFDQVEINSDFWQKRLEEAAQYREALCVAQRSITDAYRLVHGEGDQLPGLIIDVYHSVAVVQAHSIGMFKALTDISNALIKIKSLGIKSVYNKSKDALPSAFAETISDGWLIGRMEGDLVIRENGVSFLIDVEAGQKTGFFLDQRDNRALVKRYAAGKKVFNGFCYTGGFSLYALSGGASEVVSVDSSAGAIAMLEKNLSLSSFEGSHQAVKDNVLTMLGQHEDQYDIVIIDPPAFAKSLAKRHNAVQAYKRLNMMAISRVKKGGMLFTFSCSQVVDKPLFHHTVVAAAIECGRVVRIAHELSQGADHPVSAFHPEGHYLKGLVLYID